MKTRRLSEPVRPYGNIGSIRGDAILAAGRKLFCCAAVLPRGAQERHRGLDFHFWHFPGALLKNHYTTCPCPRFCTENPSNPKTTANPATSVFNNIRRINTRRGSESPPHRQS